MFNGLIREIAEVIKFDGKTLDLKAKLQPSLGDSVAVNGACLSVVRVFDFGFSVTISSESIEKIAVENFKGKVHIEPALRLADQIHGHLIQGHIDAIGEITRIETLKTGVNFYIKLPKNIIHLVANKGSIAVEGVSLTVNEILQDIMRLTIIPISLKDSLFGEFKVGRRVNIETDLLARYLERMLSLRKNELTWQEADFYANMY